MSERKQKIFVISDTHFAHNNIIQYCQRPFESVWWMDQYMIKRWNEVVGDDDIVIHCGDFAFTKAKHEVAEETLTNLTMQLKGHKILIKGNHDHKQVKYTQCGWDYECYQQLRIGNLVFEHRPEQVNGQTKHDWREGVPHNVTLKEWLDGIYPNPPRFIFYGHVHDRGIRYGDGYSCVCVELIDYTPLDITDFLTDNEYSEICKLVEA